MAVVRFTRRCNQYNASEVAEFPDVDARRLIDHGYAVVVAAQTAVEEKSEDVNVKPIEDSPAPAAGRGRSARQR